MSSRALIGLQKEAGDADAALAGADIEGAEIQHKEAGDAMAGQDHGEALAFRQGWQRINEELI